MYFCNCWYVKNYISEVIYEYYFMIITVFSILLQNYQSFTKAASILLSNEPNISRSIRNLEHEFGVSLFIRSNAV